MPKCQKMPKKCKKCQQKMPTKNGHKICLRCKFESFLDDHRADFYDLSNHHAIPGTTLIKNGPSFPPPRLFQAPRLFGTEE